MRHGIIGAKLLREKGYESYARVCETHIGTGLTIDDIVKQDLPLPLENFMPITLEEKLVCYSDNFFSKSKLAPAKSLEQVKAQVARYGYESLHRLEEMISIFE